MPVVTIGNTAPVTVDPDADPIEPGPESRQRVTIDNGRKDDHTITTFVIPETTSLLDAVRDVRAAFGGFHSDEPPAFVMCDDPVLQTVLAREFGCPTEPPRSFKGKGLLAPKED